MSIGYLPRDYHMTDLLNHRYQILKPIGEGGEYVVYLGQDTIANKKVVIKRKKDSLQSINTYDWQREAHLLEQIHLDSVVTCLDAFVSRIELIPYGYLVQEYVEGTTLDHEFIKKRYTQIEVKQIILEVLEIVIKLQHLSPPIIHRDIKPSNIIRRQSDQRLMLLDFGLAIDQTLDNLGHTIGVGSLGYQAPEQISGYPTLASDVYSIGVMAVEFLGRKAPKTLLRNQKLIWETSIATAHENWKKWLKKALAPENGRFQNAEEAWAALSQLELPLPQNEQPPPLVSEPKKKEIQKEAPKVEYKRSKRARFKEKPKAEEPFVEVLPESSHDLLSQRERKELLRKSLKKYRFWAIVLLFFGGGFFSIAAIVYLSILLNKLDNEYLEEVAQVVERIESFGCFPMGIVIITVMGCGSAIFSIFM